MDPDDQPVMVFACGPNRTCEHNFDHYEPILDSSGQECGSTLVCSKCGTSAFEIDVWDGP